MQNLKTYDLSEGYRFEILFYDEQLKKFEHIDYAKDKTERDFLLAEYRMDGNHYKSIQLPQKYWK